MTKYKARTLRKVYKPKLQKGGQTHMVYQENFNFFLDTMKRLKEEKDVIIKEAQLLYSQETQEKHISIDNSIIVKFNEELIAKANVLETTITAFLETTTSDYSSIFLKALSSLQTILNETNKLVLFSQNAQKDLNSKNIHIHLIPTFINLFESLKVNINSLQERYEIVEKEVQSTIETLKEKKPVKQVDVNDFEYIAKLSKEDVDVLGVEYVKGDLIFENDTPKQFIPKNEFVKTIIDLSNNETYYTTSDNTIHKVKISSISPSEPLREVQTKIVYYALLNEKDQILSGVQYVICDVNGTVVIENDKPVPFFPNYLELKKEGSNLFEYAPNNVDRITYVYVKQLEETYTSIHVVNEAMYDNLINPLYSNTINPFYKNKYIELKTDIYTAPFVLSRFLNNPGDFYLIHNISNIPVLFDISKTSNDKRVIVYPNQIICFVYSEKSDILQYGYLVYDKGEEGDTTSNLVAQVGSTNDYVFMTSSLINDKKEIIPLVDSEKNLIKVSNFDLSGSLYYDVDDYFNTNPIHVSVLDPIQLTNIHFSYKNGPIFTNYVCLTKFDVFVFCDENGIPVINKYGYFQPVITPIHYANNQYFYYLEDKKKTIVIKEKYDSVPNFEESYGISSQNISPYSIQYKDVQIFSDTIGNPVVYNKTVFGKVPDKYQTQLLPNSIQETFEVQEYNLEERKNYISLFHLHNMIEVYRSQTSIVYDHFKDLSGNLNNLGSYLIDFEILEKQLITTKNINLFQEIETNFDTVIQLYTQLINIEKSKKQEAININTTNELKIDNLNMIQPMEEKLKQMKETISTLQNPEDVDYLTKTVNKLDQTISILKDGIFTNNMQSGGGVEDTTLQIVQASLEILDKNLNSSIKAIEQKNIEMNEKELKEKQDTLIRMDKTILDEIHTLDDFKEKDEYYMARAPMDHEDEFNTYHTTIMTNIKTIQSIIDKVKSGTSFETPKQISPETVNTIESERKANIQLIEITKKNTYELFNTMDKVIEEGEQNELNRIKKDILILISDFEIQHRTIETLNNKLKLKQFYEINPNLLEVQQIKDTIEGQQNKDILKDNYKEVYNVYLREKDILNELQEKELKKVIGGSKKRKTRKLIIHK